MSTHCPELGYKDPKPTPVYASPSKSSDMQAWYPELPQSGDYTCDVCGLKYRYKKPFLKHIMTHNQDSKEPLAEPYSAESDKEDLLGGPKYSCIYCNATYLYKRAYQKHLQTHAQEDIEGKVGTSLVEEALKKSAKDACSEGEAANPVVDSNSSVASLHSEPFSAEREDLQLKTCTSEVTVKPFAKYNYESSFHSKNISLPENTMNYSLGESSAENTFADSSASKSSVLQRKPINHSSVESSTIYENLISISQKNLLAIYKNISGYTPESWEALKRNLINMSQKKSNPAFDYLTGYSSEKPDSYCEDSSNHLQKDFTSLQKNLMNYSSEYQTGQRNLMSHPSVRDSDCMYKQSLAHSTPGDYGTLCKQSVSQSSPEASCAHKDSGHYSPPKEGTTEREGLLYSPAGGSSTFRENLPYSPSGEPSTYRENHLYSPAGEPSTYRENHLYSLTGDSSSCRENLPFSPVVEPGTNSESFSYPPAREPSIHRKNLRYSPAGESTPCQEKIPYSPGRDSSTHRESLTYSPAGEAPAHTENIPYSPQGESSSRRENLPYSPSGDPSCRRENLAYSPSGESSSHQEKLPYSPSGESSTRRENLPYSPGSESSAHRENLSYSPAGESSSRRDNLLYSPSGESSSHRENFSYSPGESNSHRENHPYVSGGDSGAHRQNLTYSQAGESSTQRENLSYSPAGAPNTHRENLPYPSAGESSTHRENLPYPSAGESSTRRENLPYPSAGESSTHRENLPYPSAGESSTHRENLSYSPAGASNTHRENLPYSSAGEPSTCKENLPYSPAGELSSHRETLPYPDAREMSTHRDSLPYSPARQSSTPLANLTYSSLGESCSQRENLQYSSAVETNSHGKNHPYTLSKESSIHGENQPYSSAGESSSHREDLSYPSSGESSSHRENLPYSPPGTSNTHRESVDYSSVGESSCQRENLRYSPGEELSFHRDNLVQESVSQRENLSYSPGEQANFHRENSTYSQAGEINCSGENLSYSPAEESNSHRENSSYSLQDKNSTCRENLSYSMPEGPGAHREMFTYTPPGEPSTRRVNPLYQMAGESTNFSPGRETSSHRGNISYSSAEETSSHRESISYASAREPSSHRENLPYSPSEETSTHRESLSYGSTGESNSHRETFPYSSSEESSTRRENLPYSSAGESSTLRGSLSYLSTEESGTHRGNHPYSPAEESCTQSQHHPYSPRESNPPLEALPYTSVGEQSMHRGKHSYALPGDSSIQQDNLHYSPNGNAGVDKENFPYSSSVEPGVHRENLPYSPAGEQNVQRENLPYMPQEEQRTCNEPNFFPSTEKSTINDELNGISRAEKPSGITECNDYLPVRAQQRACKEYNYYSSALEGRHSEESYRYSPPREYSSHKEFTNLLPSRESAPYTVTEDARITEEPGEYDSLPDCTMNKEINFSSVDSNMTNDSKDYSPAGKSDSRDSCGYSPDRNSPLKDSADYTPALESFPCKESGYPYVQEASAHSQTAKPIFHRESSSYSSEQDSSDERISSVYTKETETIDYSLGKDSSIKEPIAFSTCGESSTNREPSAYPYEQGSVDYSYTKDSRLYREQSTCEESRAPEESLSDTQPKGSPDRAEEDQVSEPKELFGCAPAPETVMSNELTSSPAPRESPHHSLAEEASSRNTEPMLYPNDQEPSGDEASSGSAIGTETDSSRTAYEYLPGKDHDNTCMTDGTADTKAVSDHPMEEASVEREMKENSPEEKSYGALPDYMKTQDGNSKDSDSCAQNQDQDTSINDTDHSMEKVESPKDLSHCDPSVDADVQEESINYSMEGRETSENMSASCLTAEGSSSKKESEMDSSVKEPTASKTHTDDPEIQATGTCDEAASVPPDELSSRQESNDIPPVSESSVNKESNSSPKGEPSTSNEVPSHPPVTTAGDQQVRRKSTRSKKVCTYLPPEDPMDYYDIAESVMCTKPSTYFPVNESICYERPRKATARKRSAKRSTARKSTSLSARGLTVMSKEPDMYLPAEDCDDESLFHSSIMDSKSMSGSYSSKKKTYTQKEPLNLISQKSSLKRSLEISPDRANNSPKRIADSLPQDSYTHKHFNYPLPGKSNGCKNQSPEDGNVALNLSKDCKEPKHKEKKSHSEENVGNYACSYCTARYSYKKAFLKHVASHTPQTELNDSLLALEEPFSVSGSDKFFCKVCNISYSYKKAYTKHMATHSSVNSTGKSSGKTYIKQLAAHTKHVTAHTKHMTAHTKHMTAHTSDIGSGKHSSKSYSKHNSTHASKPVSGKMNSNSAAEVQPEVPQQEPCTAAESTSKGRGTKKQENKAITEASSSAVTKGVENKEDPGSNEETVEKYRCSVCSITYSYHKAYVKHMSSHTLAEINEHKAEDSVEEKSLLDVAQKYSCKYCNAMYSYRMAYIKHMANHTRGKGNEKPQNIAPKKTLAIQGVQNATKNSTPSVSKNSVPNVRKSSEPNGSKSMTPNVAKSMTPNIAKSMTPPNVAKSMTPNIAKSMTQNVSKSMTPNVAKSMTPNVAKSMTPIAPKGMAPIAPKSTAHVGPKNFAPSVAKSSALCVPKDSVTVPKGSVLATAKTSVSSNISRTQVVKAPENSEQSGTSSSLPYLSKKSASNISRNSVPNISKSSLPSLSKGSAPNVSKTSSPNVAKGSKFCCTYCPLTYSYRKAFLKHMSTHAESEVKEDLPGSGAIDLSKRKDIATTPDNPPAQQYSEGGALTDAKTDGSPSVSTRGSERKKFIRLEQKGDVLIRQLELSNTSDYACVFCSATYSYRRAFIKHLNTHKLPDESRDPENETYFCVNCDKQFALEPISEKESDSEGSKHTCKYCNAVYSKEDIYLTHLLTHLIPGDFGISKGNFLCDYCDETFDTDISRVAHIVKYKSCGGEKHICCFCNKKYCNEESYSKHMTVHFSENVESISQNDKKDKSWCPSLCKNCDLKFTSETKPKKSKYSNTNETNYPCKYCGKVFYTSKHYVNHAITHLSQKHSSGRNKDSSKNKQGVRAQSTLTKSAVLVKQEPAIAEESRNIRVYQQFQAPVSVRGSFIKREPDISESSFDTFDELNHVPNNEQLNNMQTPYVEKVANRSIKREKDDIGYQQNAPGNVSSVREGESYYLYGDCYTVRENENVPRIQSGGSQRAPGHLWRKETVSRNEPYMASNVSGSRGNKSRSEQSRPIGCDIQRVFPHGAGAKMVSVRNGEGKQESMVIDVYKTSQPLLLEPDSVEIQVPVPTRERQLGKMKSYFVAGKEIPQAHTDDPVVHASADIEFIDVDNPNGEEELDSGDNDSMDPLAL